MAARQVQHLRPGGEGEGLHGPGPGNLAALKGHKARIPYRTGHGVNGAVDQIHGKNLASTKIEFDNKWKLRYTEDAAHPIYVSQGRKAPGQQWPTPFSLWAQIRKLPRPCAPSAGQGAHLFLRGSRAAPGQELRPWGTAIGEAISQPHGKRRAGCVRGVGQICSLLLAVGNAQPRRPLLRRREDLSV